MESITSHIAEFISLINFNKTSLYRSVIITCLIPFTWNVIARNEYKYQSFSKFFPSRRFANYVLAFSIFTSSLYRDYLFKIAVDEQSEWAVLHQLKFLSIPLFLVGNVLVLTSMWKLGVSGTYLGDYFGIYMKEKVESFPFNTMENPMYNGSTMIFLSTALWSSSPAGIFLTFVIYIVYQLALAYEGPFTTQIYKNLEIEKTKLGKEE